MYRNQRRREISSWHWVYNAEKIIHSGRWFMRSSGFRWTLKASLRDLIIFSKLQLLLTYRLHYNFNYKSNQRQGQDRWHQQCSPTSDPDLCCICAKKPCTGCCWARSYITCTCSRGLLGGCCSYEPQWKCFGSYLSAFFFAQNHLPLTKRKTSKKNPNKTTLKNAFAIWEKMTVVPF